jgi:unsaturated rhamnogalacturonyl hydrolase
MVFEIPGLARTLFARHKALHSLSHYTGILSMQALARHAVKSGDPETLATAREELLPFATGRVADFGNFRGYRAGGNGAALLFLHGKLPEGAAMLQACAELQVAAPRGEDRVFCSPVPRDVPRGLIWIDTAFGVCPFLVLLGRALDRDDYVDEGVHQVVAMHRLLIDAECGLVHQGKNFNGPGSISEDHWSRGNGWGLLALAEVVDAMPADHPRRSECERLLRDWLAAALRFQDPQGLWYQEMTVCDPHVTYTETSGSGLILFALGVAVERGLMPSGREAFLKGIRGLLRYVTPRGSVYHCCTGCRCPGTGTIADYLQKPPVLDDSHAFGAVLMALVQAMGLGYSQVDSLEM